MFTLLSLFALSNAKTKMEITWHIFLFLMILDTYWTINLIKFIRCTIAILAGG